MDSKKRSDLVKESSNKVGLSIDEGKKIKEFVNGVVDTIVELTDGKPLFGKKEKEEK